MSKAQKVLDSIGEGAAENLIKAFPGMDKVISQYGTNKARFDAKAMLIVAYNTHFKMEASKVSFIDAFSSAMGKVK